MNGTKRSAEAVGNLVILHVLCLLVTLPLDAKLSLTLVLNQVTVGERSAVE